MEFVLYFSVNGMKNGACKVILIFPICCSPTITKAIIKSINGNIVNMQSTIYLKIKLKNENNNMKIMKNIILILYLRIWL